MAWLVEIFQYSESATFSQGNYKAWLVALSVIIAILTSTMALQISSQAAQFKKKQLRKISTVVGALALGGGVWSMHFIGMLALDLHTEVDYHWGLTMLSILPSTAASFVALRLIGQGEISTKQLLIGGLLVGGGIGTMHYMGMAAMQMAPTQHYHLGYFLLSIVSAVSLAILALWVRYGLRTILQAELGEWLLNLISGVVMGSAISSMHYIGMAAARFTVPDDMAMTAGASSNSLLLALAIALITTLITFSVVVANLMLKYRDISQDALASEGRLRAMMDTAADGIVIITAEGVVLGLNKMAESLFGWSSEEVKGKKVNTLMPDPYSSEHDDYLHRYLTTGERKIIGIGREVQALHSDGHVIPIRLAVGHVQLPDEDLFVAFVSDISERIKAEEELKLAKEKAEHAAKTKSEFLANMSHEIRTPMNAIIGFGDLLSEEELTAQQTKYLDNINKAAKSLLHLLNDILHSAKLEQGKLELEQVNFSIHELVDGVISTLWIQARKKGLELSFEIDPKLHEVYFGAADRVRQVLLNIVGNSIKFTEKGSVELKVVANGADQVRFSISDSGMGIAPDRLESIFEPFTQADASMTRRFGGTGLGTTISKQLVELMGGSIWATSTLGEGSCFEFEVPLKQGKHEEQRSSSGPSVALPALSVLICDDIQQNLDLLQLQLSRAGHSVVSAMNGEEVLASFKQGSFDLVLMDVQMPVMDGLAASRAIRDWEVSQGREKTPIIALTASVDVEDRRATKEAGMQGFASKPLDFKELCLEIARVLDISLSPSAKESSPAQQTKKDEVIDQDKALQLWLSWPVYLAELEKFMGDAPRVASELAASLENADFDALAKRCHALVGVCGNLALSSLSKTIARLEVAAKQEATDKCVALCDTVDVEFGALNEEAEALKQRYGESLESPEETLSLDELRALVERLQTTAQSNELDDELLASIKDAMPAHRGLVDKIGDAFNDFDFEQASVLAIKLAKELERGEQ